MIGSYRLAKRHRGIVSIAGHVSMRLDHSDLIRGKAGADLALEEACEAARACALHMLSTLRTETGLLDQVASILKVFGMVNVAPGFVQLAKVMDGCTDQLVQVFGKGAGTPAAMREPGNSRGTAFIRRDLSENAHEILAHDFLSVVMIEAS